MKKIFLTLLICFMASTASAFDITITIPDPKVNTYKPMFFALYPNIEKDSEGDPLYSDAQWFKEVTKRWIIKQIKRGDIKLQKEAISSDNGDDVTSN